MVLVCIDRIAQSIGLEGYGSMLANVLHIAILARMSKGRGAPLSKELEAETARMEQRLRALKEERERLLGKMDAG